MDIVLERAVALLEQGQEFAFAVVIAQDGSTPRGEGSRMLITADATVASIGGGLAEAKVMEKARTEILPEKSAEIYSFDMRQDSNIDPELICGGKTDILVAYVAGEAMLEVFRAARDAERSGKKAWIFYLFDRNGAKPFQCCVNTGRGQVVGQFTGQAKFARDMLENPVRAAVHGDSSDGVRCIMQEINASGKVLLFGGGHVSYEVARLAVNLGFDVTVIDDREEYCNPDRFPDCHTVLIDDFTSMPDFETTENSYILIITRGHAYDRDVLRWALNKPCLYLGMIGSISKRDALYRKLEAEGFSMERLRQVKCPIGLKIGAETPAEIAVSILAEMIQETKAKQK